MLSDLLKKIFSYLFPPTCIVCGDENTGINLCMACADILPLTREMRKPWLFSLYRYRNDSVGTCVRHLKHFPDVELVTRMIDKKYVMITGWTLGALRIFGCDNIVIVPVPIHHSRYVDRGYNQAEVIAGAYQTVLKKHLKRIPVTIEKDFIVKSKKTDKQALIHDRAVRLQNIRNAFSINTNSKSGKNASHFSRSLIIIIDDVTTTGGTLEEIRNVLLPHTKAVFAFTLAH